MTSGQARAALVLLLLLTAAVRVSLLAASDGALNGDEATTGILAQRILSRGERPVFFLGHHYNGGAAVEAYMLSALFQLSGQRTSEAVMKTLPLGLGLLAVFVVYATLRRTHGEGAALTAAGLYASSAALIRWSLDSAGGYGACQVLIPLTLGFLHRSSQQPRGAGLGAGLALGCLGGFGTYLLTPFLGVAATSLTWLAFSCWRNRRGWRALVGFAAGLPVGALPLHLFASGPAAGDAGLDGIVTRLGRLPAALSTALVYDWPRALSADTLYGFPPFRILPNVTEAVALSTGLALLAFLGGRTRREARGPGIESVLALYLAVYLFMYSMHPLAGTNARYLLFLEPAVSMLAGLGFHAALARDLPGPGNLLRVAAVAALVLALTGRGAEYARVRSDPAIHGPSGRHPIQVAPDLIRRLDTLGVAHFMTEDWDLRWRVMFLTEERMHVAHLSHRFFYDPTAEIRQAPVYALVVNKGNRTHAWIGEAIAARQPTPPRLTLGELVIFICEPSTPCADL